MILKIISSIFLLIVLSNCGFKPVTKATLKITILLKLIFLEIKE